MLPWFKADTEEVFGGVMTFDWPCPAPKHLARIELQAIMLGPKPELWTHEKLAKRFNRPVSWVRALRREAGIKQAISSGQTDDKQDIDSKQTGSRQATDSKQTGSRQAFSLHTAENQTSVSSKQADDRQAVDRQQTASKQATDSHQADVKQPSCARTSLDSRLEIKDVDQDRDLRTDKEEHGESLISMGDALVVGVPVQSSLMDALKPTEPSKPTKAPKQAKEAKPPKAHTETIAPPDISEVWKDSKLWCGIWYGTECRTKDGPNRELFDTIAEVAERFRESSGIELMMDRKAYNFVKDTISQWLEQGGTKKQLLTAAECPADDWLMKRGLWTFQNQFGSIGRIQANSGKASKPVDPKVDNLGRQQDSTSFMERLKQMYPPKKETTDAK